MSDLAFHCVVCGRKLHISPEPAGSVVECPHCLRVVPVPSLMAPEHLPCAAAAFPLEILAVEMKFLCAKCDAKLEVDVRMQDREVACPKCAAAIRVPRLRAEPRPSSAGSPQTAVTPLLSLAETEFLSGLREPVAAVR